MGEGASRLNTLAEGKARRGANPIVLTAFLLAAALVAWIVTVDRMQGMDAGPGTDLGGLAWYLGIWVTMMAAMMLPSVAPMALMFERVSVERRRRGGAFVPTWVFLAGYLAAWTAYGLAAYAFYRLVKSADLGFLAWDAHGPIVAGVAIAAAGVYQLLPIKDICLRHCRTPFHFIIHGWREGRIGAVRMGLEHGAYCIGCCWGLMLVLFALGVMSLVWMALIAAVIFAEKVLPYGARLTTPIAVALVATGIWVAVAPGTVPGLTDPNSAPAMNMNDTGGTNMDTSNGMDKTDSGGMGMNKTSGMSKPAKTSVMEKANEPAGMETKGMTP